MNAGNTVCPNKYGKNRNTPIEVDVLNALNVIPECARGQAGVKYLEVLLIHLVFAGGLNGCQGSDRAVGTSQDYTAHSPIFTPPPFPTEGCASNDCLLSKYDTPWCK